MRARNESLRSAFLRARQCGALDDVPGLVYSRAATPEGPIEELVDTGIQRLVEDLDELPHPVLGYQLLEPPGNQATLGLQALPAHRVRKHCIVSSLVLTVGCKFRCPYCPIPAYNQRQFRAKSGERVADEMEQIAGTYGITNFFGADDNFFNDTSRTLDIAQTLAREISTRKRPLCKIRWATEATIHDTLRIREHLPVVRAIRADGVVAGRGRHHRVAGQQGTKRRQDHRGVSPAAGKRHLSRAHADAPRLATPGHVEEQLRTSQPIEGPAQGRGAVHAGADADTLAGLQVVRGHVHVGACDPGGQRRRPSNRTSWMATMWSLPGIRGRGSSS